MKARAIGARSLKYLLVSLLFFVLIIMGLRFLQHKSWFLGFFFAISAFLIFYIYLIHKKVPAKYLLPGVLLLALFQIYPAFYSGYVAFTNDSNGHQITKAQAISSIVDNSNFPVENIGPIGFRASTENGSGKLFVIFQFPVGTYWAGNSTALVALSPSDIKFTADNSIGAVTGYKLLDSAATESAGADLENIQVHLQSGIVLQPQDFKTLQAFKASMLYSQSRDEFTNIQTGMKYHPNKNGQMVSASGDVLYPGWKTTVGWRNFSSIISNVEIRKPLLAVLAWTFINAGLIVALSFLMGLVLALIFNSPLLNSKRIYRTVFIFPMAIPNVLSVLVWSGLFTTQSGVIDRLFHISTPWLTSSTWARVAVLIVELWVTFPYMFLISTGAIQAIPSEIIEAAEIDGASQFSLFRLIKLPLVLRTVAPLLVASIAMALNNFGVIYLLTGGGPTFPKTNGNAGATDILISYTYKLAFNSQEGNNYGLASALSILNFILVGCISIYGLRRMKTMEGLN